MSNVGYIDLKVKPKGFQPNPNQLKDLDDLLQRVSAVLCQNLNNGNWHYEPDGQGQYQVRILDPRTTTGVEGMAEKMARRFIEHCGFEVVSKEEFGE